ncbi:MAG: stage II sporulation protein M, partial [Polyangia bacterium]|nr:stage II sporulation protein M [Polyangia bacterium]
MSRARFLANRQEDWYRFRALLDRAEGTRVKKLTGQELSDLSRLFRALCYDLAVVRSRDWGGELEGRLNDLVVRGHNLIYQAPPGRPRAVLDFLLSGFPLLLRANAGYFWVALALFVVPGLVAGALIALEPELASRVMSPQTQAMMEEMHSKDHGERALFSGGEAAKFGFYVVNNIGIAFKAFALGILLGIGTMLILVYNGIVIGAVTGYLIARGHAEPFFSFVIGHGSFELTAIVIAGAAGLVLG